MGYVAVKGGKEAIENSNRALDLKSLDSDCCSLSLDQIKSQLHFLVDKVMSEGSLYDPDLAALAIKQSAGDVFEAAFMVRAYRATLPRIASSVAESTKEMRVVRRISSAFKEIPGGQILGPSADYSLRLLDFSLCWQTAEERKQLLKHFLSEAGLKEDVPETFPKVIDLLRSEGLIVSEGALGGREQAMDDVTRESIQFPASRSAALQTMARGESGGMLVLAYSNMRGYGSAHPTIGELRVGYVPVKVKNPFTSEITVVGEVPVTEAEIISGISNAEGEPKFEVGYGLCFGHNETKAISMAMLDVAMRAEKPKYPSEDQEFVLTHIDGIEAMGFANHFKLPHYVTFQSELDRLRKSKSNSKKNEL